MPFCHLSPLAAAVNFRDSCPNGKQLKGKPSTWIFMACPAPNAVCVRPSLRSVELRTE